ncbi:hypothetical protein [Stappia sp. WLB 29]|uniref:hypothetical protein n=1 Tax=Stappia sp. WLB 29 TaxID=2925220 RepID=UPI0020BE9191|nr:hypothetical protein [Stappia sp. WLB 29]
MSEIVRVIALAIVTFFVTAVVLVISNQELAQAVLSRFGFESPQEEAIDDGRAGVALVPGDTVFAIGNPDGARWTGLTGFPSSVELRFPLPRDLPVIGGQLRLVLNTQLVDNGDGLVTVAVNGVQRDALVLEAGQRTLELLYDLSPAELAGDAVVVSLTGNGTTNQGQICPTNVTNLGAAIELASTSALMLKLSSPAESDEADLIALPEPLWLGSPEPAASIWAAQYLSRMGVKSVFASSETAGLVIAASEGEPLTREETGQFVIGGVPGVEHLAGVRGAALPAIYGESWPVAVEALGADLHASTFRGSRRWEINYKLADMPGGKAPDVLNLNLVTSTLGAPYDWVVRVMLNDQLVHSATYDGRSERISIEVQLPSRMSGLNNRIVVALTDPSPNQGICRAGPEAAAQMLETTTLGHVASGSAPAREIVTSRLATTESVSISAATNLNHSQAMRATGLLALVLPLTTAIAFDTVEAPVTIDAVGQHELDSMLAEGVEDEGAYIVYAGDASDPARVEIEPLSRERAPQLGTFGSALVVRWP